MGGGGVLESIRLGLIREVGTNNQRKRQEGERGWRGVVRDICKKKKKKGEGKRGSLSVEMIAPGARLVLFSK